MATCADEATIILSWTRIGVKIIIIGFMQINVHTWIASNLDKCNGVQDVSYINPEAKHIHKGINQKLTGAAVDLINRVMTI